MESTSISAYSNWRCDSQCNIKYLETHEHILDCLHSVITWNWTSTVYSQFGRWSSLIILDTHWPCNSLLAASTHVHVFHWHYACSHFSLPLALKSQVMFGLDGQPAKCCKWQIMLRSQLFTYLCRQQEIYGRLVGKNQRDIAGIFWHCF